MRKKDFILPPDQVYMCGHSLGPMPKLAKLQVEQVMQTWGDDAVKAWNTDAWIDLPGHVAAKIAPFIGVEPSDVVVSDSTSVNLFKVLMSALNINHSRHVILTTDDNFPADHYVAQGIQAFYKTAQLKIVSRECLLENLNEQVAVLMLTHVNYRDARVHDLQHITYMAHQQGILTVWDLSHSVGAVSLDVRASHADFAVGCTYKYLSGGPGAPAFIYSHKRHQQALTTPIYGWMGHDNPFAFDAMFQARRVTQFLGGTPYIVSLKALSGALNALDGLSMKMLYEKSLQYSNVLIHALRAQGLNVLTPLDDARGGHVAFLHAEGQALARALIDHGVIVDYRKPGLIRMCVHPLYLNLSDICRCIETLHHLLERRIYQAPCYQHALKVT